MPLLEILALDVKISALHRNEFGAYLEEAPMFDYEDDDERREQLAFTLVTASLSLYVGSFVGFAILGTAFSGNELLLLLLLFACHALSIGLTIAAAVIHEKWLFVAALGQAAFALLFLMSAIA